MNPNDPRLRVCLDWCWLPDGSCERDPRCPFCRDRRGQMLSVAEQVKRCEWALEAGWLD